MNRIFFVFGLCGILALSACQGADVDKGKLAASAVGSLTPTILPPDKVAVLGAVCRGAMPALDIATAPMMPAELRETAVYPQAYCGPLLAGTVPPTTDANTPEWLPDTLATVSMVAKIAGVVLPLML